MEYAKHKPLLGPYSAGNLVLIRAVTSLHPGVGRSGEEVDLAVQRDNIGFPIIYASSIKGALKSTIWRVDSRMANLLLGPETEEEKFASAVGMLDGFLLAMPVRSLIGTYAFLTTPLLLQKFSEVIEFVEAVGVQGLGMLSERIRETLKDFREIHRNSAVVSSSHRLKVESFGIIINEELQLEPIEKASVENLESVLGIEGGRLVVVNDDSGVVQINRGLIRATRVKLKRETKTAEGGNLWTEEYIPHGTIFCTAFFYSRPFKAEGDIDSAEKVKDKVKELLNSFGNYLIIGGHETIGRGIVKLDLWD
jgi:CRISPR-associated protein Cmr4